jgi:tetratricopeptide (TPR) repeat protein
MPKQQTDFLLQLISNMTSAEKRSFKLYVKRNSPKGEILFLQLFDLLDKEKEYNADRILKKLPKIKRSQLSNIKANLYQQLLTCLRLIQTKKVEEIKVREHIDYAKILYDKGMYRACLEILEKAKKLSIDINYETLILTILYFEKRIESQHITGSMSNRALYLSRESSNLLEDLKLTNDLSNLSLLLYGRYLKNGLVRDVNDYNKLASYFKSKLPDFCNRDLNFYQSLYLYQSYVWFYNMTHDFSLYYKYAQRWLDLFHNTPGSEVTETPQYLKGLHNLLNALFMVQRKERFIQAFTELQNFDIENKKNVTANEISLWYLYTNIHLLNKIFLTADYKQGVASIADLETLLDRNTFNWDSNRNLVFFYKIACVYFGSGDLEKAIDYLNKITNRYLPELREDIQCYARILNLVAHFDLGNEEHVNYQVKSMIRFLSKIKEHEAMQLEILKFLKRTTQMRPKDMSMEFSRLRDKLILISQDKYQQRAFFYFDIISWLESKIQGKSIQDIILQKKKISIK